MHDYEKPKRGGRRGAPFPWLAGAYCAFTVTLILVLSLAGWSALVDFQDARSNLLRSEVHRLRSHALRTVVLLQDQFGGKLTALTELQDFTWLREHWQRSIPGDDARLYGALIDTDGRIVMHFRRESEGKRLAANWYGRRVPEAGDDVVETSDPALTGGLTALDISIPVVQGDREIGTYHSGFNSAWFENQLSTRQAVTRRRWAIVFALIAFVLLAAGVSLVHIAKRLSGLQADVATSQVRRLAELGQLAGGIAHEIRNPLNSIRLNLHVVRKLWPNRQETAERAYGIMDETVQEIERVDELLRSLLGYARPEKAQPENVNVADELQSIALLLRPQMERDRIRFESSIPTTPVSARMDRGRFRQIVLNLLKNSIEAIGTDGRISASLRADDERISLTISDDGPGIPPSESGKIFDAFFTTKELGTGLGLTLVRRFVEEAGGSVTYKPGSPRGSTFIVELPAVSESLDVREAETAGTQV